MNYCLHITSAPYQQPGANTALLFAEALLHKGHHLKRVFFSGQGVLNANALCIPPQDEINIPLAWQKLGHEHACELQVCIASALRLGIVDEAEAARYDRKQHSMLDGFELSGLGQLVEACITYDRVIRF